MGDRVVGHANADRAALGMLQATRNLARCRQQKGVASWRAEPDDAELPVVEAREAADLGQIAQHERQVVSLGNTANLADTPCGVRIADVTAQRVAGIRGVRDYAPVAQDFRRLPDQPGLRMGWVNCEYLGHRQQRGQQRAQRGQVPQRKAI